MTYSKKTWATGDIITAPELNRMENGINAHESEKANLVKVLETNLPTLPAGDIAYTTDTRKYFIGTDLGNKELVLADVIGQLSNLVTQDRSNIVNAINEVKMFEGSGGGTATSLSKEAFSNGKTSFSHAPKTPKAYMTIIDDDAHNAVMTKLKSLVVSKGVPISLAVPVNPMWGGSTMTRDEVLQMQSLGCEIMSHTYTHPLLSSLSEKDLERELGEAKKALIEKGYDIKNIVYPSGNSNDLVRKIASKYYNSGYNTLGGIVTTPLKSMTVNRVVFGPFSNKSNDTYEYYKGTIDEAISKNGWVVFNTHCYHVEHTDTHQQWLSDLIDYAKANNVSIVNAQEGYDVFGNLLEVETKLTITKSGEITGDRFISTVFDNLIANDAPVTSYAKRTVTYSDFGGTTGGLSEWGVLVTYRHTDDNNYTKSYQQVFGNTGKVYSRRTVSGTDPTWGSFTGSGSDIPTYTYPMAGDSIPANSFKDIQITHPNAGQLDVKDAIIAMPSGGLENGLIFNTHLWGNKVIILRIHNFTASPISTATKNWYIHVVKAK
ncbi:polysaccharide deacetylase family protein [Bacillus sp. OK048]|uniref:polysaccharide deacetylase family protein n=1 Tax=Bacillus sp. OK048 TaxID=1882761 RepID=UPI000886B2DA|nr:polysaccharide deacetylase family protein [Bacillus sp. OK048]SDM17178.1 Peptidoglycan/xylan/chitin deacetylase, PgdA/CDA1 family [Bacillus sp. OK048]